MNSSLTIPLNVANGTCSPSHKSVVGLPSGELPGELCRQTGTLELHLLSIMIDSRFDFAPIKTLWLISLNKSRVVSASVCFPKQIVNFEVRYAINLQQQRGRSRNTSCAKGRGGQQKCDCSWKEDRKKRDVRGEGSKSLKIARRIMWTTPTTPTPLDHPTLKC